MISRLLIAGVLVVGMFVVVEPASAVGRRTTTVLRARVTRRQAIRQMPILQRPDRPGHAESGAVQAAPSGRVFS